MPRHSLYFTAPRTLAIREDPLPPLASGQVRVQTILSAISPGTELLIYRGEAPHDMATDDTLASLSGKLTFPLKYGYSAVGKIVELGLDVETTWLNKHVFAFNPHETQFIAEASSLVELPPGLALEDAVFLPNMETAVNFLHDGAPLVGERVAVFGQGIVGLLTTALLAHIPLASLVTFDRYPHRRELSLTLGATESLDPATAQASPHGFDLTYELSGSPDALEQAITFTGFDGRVVIGSWYGTKPAHLNLGGRFHRSRIKLIGSQVSTLAPTLTGRWTKPRQLNFALQLLGQCQPSRFITHRIPFNDAAQAYQLLDQKPEDAVQVVLTYK